MPAPPTARGKPVPRYRVGSWAARLDPREFRSRRRLEIRLEAIDVDGVARTGVRSPELAALEADGVAVRGHLRAALRVLVGQDEDAVIAIDHADLVARVTRQARVARRVQVLRAHAVAGLEARRREAIPHAGRPAVTQ